MESDPAFMAEWELLTVLISLHTWRTHLTGKRAGFLLQMASKAALGAALKLASPTPSVNLIAADIAFTLELLNIERLAGEHFRGTVNVEADALSRLLEGKEIPRSLWGIKASRVPPRSSIYLVRTRFDDVGCQEACS